MKHLYNAKIEKFRWFAKRFGTKEIFLKPLRTLFASIIINLKKKNTFAYQNKNYELFYHKYNTTWATERCVEVPIVYDKITHEKGSVLEVGNVLSHYYNPTWEVIDKFERGKKVQNQDISIFKPNKKYNLIVSISTFEHIGYDDDSLDSSAKKIITAWNNLKDNFLLKGGKLIITVPIGYNPEMDEIISQNRLNFTKEIFLKRIEDNGWIEVTKDVLCNVNMQSLFPMATQF